MDTSKLDDIILALLFASEEPLPVRKIASVLGEVSVPDVKDALGRLETRTRENTPSIVLEQVAGGYQLSTNPEYANYVAGLYSGRRKHRLSKAAMESLAIVAYKQPITRAEMENIRGVGCGGVITTLMERSLIKIVGKAKVLGAPFLYGTTQEFLEYLGLNSLKDLPTIEELEALLEEEESAREGEEESATAIAGNESPSEGVAEGTGDTTVAKETEPEDPRLDDDSTGPHSPDEPQEVPFDDREK